MKGSATNDTLTFYPVWEANVLYVYFNANGATIDSDTYKLSNEIVCYQSDGSKAYNKWVYNEKKKNGLTNVTTLGLTKAGHTFAGWGTSSDTTTAKYQPGASYTWAIVLSVLILIARKNLFCMSI